MMTQGCIVNKSEIYYIFAEGLKEPSAEWVDWYNDTGRDTLITLLDAVSYSFGEEVSSNLPEKLCFDKLKHLYANSFQVPGSNRVVLVESVYKNWANSGTNLSSSEGYLMGDSAVHMNYIFGELGIDIPEEFKTMPDHLVLQLELLALLEENGNRLFINQYVFEHIDWTNHLLEDCQKKNWSGFYYGWLNVIHQYFKNRFWEC